MSAVAVVNDAGKLVGVLSLSDIKVSLSFLSLTIWSKLDIMPCIGNSFLTASKDISINSEGAIGLEPFL